MTKKIAKVYSQSHWCFLRTAPNLRAAVKFRMEQLGKKGMDLAKEVGIPQYRISTYLNGMNKPMTQYHLLQLCKYLGITVDLKVGFSDELYPEPDVLKNLYERST